jgi:hypothetical protein
MSVAAFGSSAFERDCATYWSASRFLFFSGNFSVNEAAFGSASMKGCLDRGIEAWPRGPRDVVSASGDVLS